MSTPALLRLSEAQPGAHITLQTHAKLADLWNEHPAVDALLTFKDGEGVWTIARRLRHGRFHAGLILPNSFRSAFELRLARIPQRVGLQANARTWLLTDPVQPLVETVRMRKKSVAEIHRLIGTERMLPQREVPARAHHIDHYLHLASFLGASTEPIPPALAIKGTEV